VRAADGTMALALARKSVASGKADGPPDHQRMDNFCVGHNDKVPGDDYHGKHFSRLGPKTSASPPLPCRRDERFGNSHTDPEIHKAIPQRRVK